MAKKNITAFILLATIAITALAGCAGTAPAETRKGTEIQEAVPDTENDPAARTDSETGKKQDGSESIQTEEQSVIVVYFSCTGNTRPIAECIAEELRADIYEIEAKDPYTEDDIKYYTDCRADREQNDPEARPEIAGEIPDLSGYDTVYLGYPIWHGQAPKIIYTFIENTDLSGKTVIPFCTSGSSPVGTSADNLHPLAPEADWMEGTRFAAGTSKDQISSWLEQYR